MSCLFLRLEYAKNRETIPLQNIMRTATAPRLLPELIEPVLEYLSIPFLRLVCRRVSREWRYATDTVIPKLLLRPPLRAEMAYLDHVLMRYEYVNFDTLQLIDERQDGVEENSGVREESYKDRLVVFRPKPAGDVWFQVWHGFSAEHDASVWEDVRFSDGSWESNCDGFLPRVVYDISAVGGSGIKVARRGPWTLEYEVLDEHEDSGGYDGDDDFDEAYEIRVRLVSITITLRHLLTWDGMRRIRIEHSRAFFDQKKLREVEANEDERTRRRRRGR
ncbi:uncharacterized protein EV422DRAFT_434494 [Fimicolochytrium jonesii]|uniref:uncharacterized protein n=1 Tax=Fimicolochytrium jonesii TaxID=1396493 RepID=UPI0022FE5968|nr:uncharacterized protein EV422DRAFT_434494 [Fimicolochytrium jonesii]KAI8821836.1 hypothetical protein EV422DRAFT_434494 [Fimicolochytrium jonesii]